MTFEDDTTCCKMHKLGVFPFFVTIGDILRHKLYSVITIGVMLQIDLKLILVLVLRCNLPSQIVTPLDMRGEKLSMNPKHINQQFGCEKSKLPDFLIFLKR